MKLNETKHFYFIKYFLLRKFVGHNDSIIKDVCEMNRKIDIFYPFYFGTFLSTTDYR